MACYLTYKGIFDDPKDALVYFGQARSTKERGVTQVSQVRYVNPKAIRKLHRLIFQLDTWTTLPRFCIRV